MVDIILEKEFVPLSLARRKAKFIRLQERQSYRNRLRTRLALERGTRCCCRCLQWCKSLVTSNIRAFYVLTIESVYLLVNAYFPGTYYMV